jgi:hypothetical protein
VPRGRTWSHYAECLYVSITEAAQPFHYF